MDDQITKCQQAPEYSGHSIAYVSSCEYHDKRHAAGDRQVYCKTCQRWKYQTKHTIGGFGCSGDVLCDEGVT